MRRTPPLRGGGADREPLKMQALSPSVACIFSGSRMRRIGRAQPGRRATQAIALRGPRSTRLRVFVFSWPS
jgi:hypothetical protein